MLRPLIAITVALLFGVTTPGLAGDVSNGYQPNSPWHNFWVDWHRNNAWTKPFVDVDTASVWNVVDAQVAKGWETQDLLGDAHFESGNTKLSPAGQLKVHEILTRNPVAFRSVFVAQGWTEDVTAKRLATAQAATAQMVGPGPMPPVLVSNLEPATTPAENVAGVNTWYNGFMTSIPKPQVKAFQQDDDSSGGGSP
ncbi:MAG TPA: hypothetical protein VFE46_08675 [Pirellulales bacterium]|jgi:hypothetical protein|nr:hypothetical protein [Pirellulales bacterium]